MIFVTLGSQKFQFNRLLKEIDRLVENGTIKEEVFAQSGYSNYVPKNYKSKNFLDRYEFSEIMDRCDKVITHGGTGAIVTAIKKNKKVIAAPRLKKFNEHIDDHQIQIVEMFTELNLICGVLNENSLGKVYINIDNVNLEKYISNTKVILDDINLFLDDLL
ncbi:PssE/Cps14G family polysaccharide biosynthesis glycosyltransferase [Clostridium perfringens]|uniref:PssE/Cps14G family polysaccharide biosynthesis glycosyltransferase n=1 Tax=Clostridium perfringens TaxID=1502 RepID=UPI002ACEC2A4|nr:PssE/Cps14G family polysaccharide biosynthesis glycosyltransferase [Clostridium perfringens]MDZ7546002.1 beta(1,3)galactosyltransferase EpsH [Clostridium perfringens]